MVHASAVTDHPIRQATNGIMEVFVDTIVVCLMTGLGGADDERVAVGETGAALAGKAFAAGLPAEWGHFVVSSGLILFAFSTIVGWAYYGETGITFLLGQRAVLPYRLLWIVFVYLGANGSLCAVWSIADTLNGLMAVPNLVGVLLSIPLLRRLMRDFFRPA